MIITIEAGKVFAKFVFIHDKKYKTLGNLRIKGNLFLQREHFFSIW